MASGLMIECVANFAESFGLVCAANKQEDGSHRDFYDRFGDRCRNRLTMLFQTFKIALNSVANVHHRFVTSFPLRYAARQSRAFSDKYAVFVWFNRDAKFHVASLPIAAAVRNVTLCG